MELHRSPTPFNTPLALQEYEKRCNKAKCNVDYPPCDCRTPSIYPAQGYGFDTCRPFGYQPKRHNPGGLKFSMYDYNFQTVWGKPLKHYGKGWYKYETTGKY